MESVGVTHQGSRFNHKVSVIVPTFNSERTLEVCLESVYGEMYPDIEIIVVDGYSVDGTIDIAMRMGVHFILSEGGRAQARNVGLFYSTGTYVFFLDSDQELVPGTLSECVKSCVEFDADAVKIPEVYIGGDFWSICSALWKNTVVEAHGRKGGIPRFYKRNLLNERFRFRDGLGYWEDEELYTRLGKEGMTTVWCGGLVIHFEKGGLKDIIGKYLGYGGAASKALQYNSLKPIFLKTAGITFQAFYLLLKMPKTPLNTYFGAFVITVVKIFCFSLGLVRRVLS